MSSDDALAIVSHVWTRYPCGVACGAGELVEQQKPLDGGSWTVSALYLQGISLVRRNNEWHHFDPLGTAQVITNNSAGVVSNNLYDLFGVLRYQQGSAQTPWSWRGAIRREESLLISSGSLFVLPQTGITSLGFLLPGIGYIFTESCLTGCARPVGTVLDKVVLPILRLLRPIRFQL